MFTQAELTMRLDRIQNKMNALEDQKVIRNMFLNDCLCFDIRLIIFNYKNKCLQFNFEVYYYLFIKCLNRRR